MTEETKPKPTTARTTATAKKTETKTAPDNRLKDVDSELLWTVVGLPDCEWTSKAISLLKAHKETYKRVDLNMEWQRRLVVEFNTRKSPAIFRGASFFGSYADLENHYKATFFSAHEKL